MGQHAIITHMSQLIGQGCGNGSNGCPEGLLIEKSFNSEDLAAYLVAQNTPVAGRAGFAAKFYGSPTKLTLPAGRLLEGNAFTIEFSMRTAAGVASTAVLLNYGEFTPGVASPLTIAWSKFKGFYCSVTMEDGSTVTSADGNAYNDGAWHFVACVYEEGSVKLYVDDSAAPEGSSQSSSQILAGAGAGIFISI